MKSQRQSLIQYVESIPTNAEFTSTSISRETRLSSSYVSAVLGELRQTGKIQVKREERGETGKRWRYVYTRKSNDDGVALMKRTLIKQFSSEELLSELALRVK